MSNRAKTSYRFHIYDGLDSVSQIREDAKMVFREFIPEKEIYGFNLVLTEMLNNAVIHGNRLNKELQVNGFICFSLENNEVKIEINDEGKGFDWSEVHQEKSCSPNSKSVMAETGRGFMIVRMYGYSYNFNETGNRVTLVKRFESN